MIAKQVPTIAIINSMLSLAFMASPMNPKQTRIIVTSMVFNQILLLIILLFYHSVSNHHTLFHYFAIDGIEVGVVVSKFGE